jgi:hypothetical protein
VVYFHRLALNRNPPDLSLPGVSHWRQTKKKFFKKKNTQFTNSQSLKTGGQ